MFERKASRHSARHLARLRWAEAMRQDADLGRHAHGLPAITAIYTAAGVEMHGVGFSIGRITHEQRKYQTCKSEIPIAPWHNWLHNPTEASVTLVEVRFSAHNRTEWNSPGPRPQTYSTGSNQVELPRDPLRRRCRRLFLVMHQLPL